MRYDIELTNDVFILQMSVFEVDKQFDNKSTKQYSYIHH